MYVRGTHFVRDYTRCTVFFGNHTYLSMKPDDHESIVRNQYFVLLICKKCFYCIPLLAFRSGIKVDIISWKCQLGAKKSNVFSQIALLCKYSFIPVKQLWYIFKCLKTTKRILTSIYSI